MTESKTETIVIQASERPASMDRGSTLWDVRQKHKPDADILIHNGFPVSEDRALADGDAVVLIRRGEIPRHEDLEARKRRASQARVSSPYLGRDHMKIEPSSAPE